MHGARATQVHELWTNQHSELAGEALKLFAALYDIERLAAELDAEGRRRLRELRSKPIPDTLHDWLVLHRLDRGGERGGGSTRAAVSIPQRINLAERRPSGPEGWEITGRISAQRPYQGACHRGRDRSDFLPSRLPKPRLRPSGGSATRALRRP